MFTIAMITNHDDNEDEDDTKDDCDDYNLAGQVGRQVATISSEDDESEVVTKDDYNLAGQVELRNDGNRFQVN